MSKPLIENEGKAIALYDPSAMVDMDEKIARGYATLLGGGCGLPRPKTIEPSAVQVGFLALTDGTVVEACFGLSTSGKSASSKGHAMVQKVKRLLDSTASSSESFRKLAVETYFDAFAVVVTTQAEVKKLNFITRCFFYSGIVKKAQSDLDAIFQPLAEALQASS